MEAAANLHEDLPLAPRMSRLAYLATLQTRLGEEKAHQRELAKAAEIGSQAHSYIEWTLRRERGEAVGPEPRISDKALWAFMVWQDWQASGSSGRSRSSRNCVLLDAPHLRTPSCHWAARQLPTGRSPTPAEHYRLAACSTGPSG
jgi:hypothetical protein